MHCTKVSAEFEFGGHSPPWVSIPANVAFGYDVGKLSAGCLVILLFTLRGSNAVKQAILFLSACVCLRNNY